MKLTGYYIGLSLIVGCCLTACTKKQYAIGSIESTRVEMDSTWDAKANPKMVALVNSYKIKLESEMNVEVGTAVETMMKGFPQSLLTNFTADAMKLYADEYLGGADFAVVNNGGLRSSLSKGKIMLGSLYEIYSFDNQIVILSLPGKAVRELFEHFAVSGGDGLSTGLRFIIKNKSIKSLEIGGLRLDEDKTYQVVTLDYLAEGNSGMEAFKQAVRYTDSGTTLRDVMINHVKMCTKENRPIDSKLDDRIVIEK